MLQSNTTQLDEIYQRINMLAALENNAYCSGYETCEYKHDLLKLLWFLEDTIKNCSVYVGEEKWYQERTIELLTREDSKQ